MAGESVGKISLDLELQSDLKEQIKSISQSAGNGIKNTLSGFMQKAFGNMQKQTKEQSKELSKTIKSQMDDASSVMKKGFSSGDSNVNPKQLEAIKRQEIAIDTLKLKYEKMMSTDITPKGLKQAETELKKLRSEIINTEKSYADAEKRMEQAKLSAQLDKGAKGSVSPESANAIRQIESELDNLGFKLAESNDKALKLQETIKILSLSQNINPDIEILKRKLELAEEKLRRFNSEIKKGSKLSSAFGKIKNALSKIGTGLKKTSGKVAGFFKSFLGGSKKATSAVGGLGKGILRLRNMLKMLVIRKIMQAIVQGLKEGMDNLTQYSSSTNKSLYMIMSALTRLKNSFATAFAPILNVVAPILTSFINMLSEAVTKVAAFFAALTGQKSYVRAVSVTEDYASSLGSATSGADKAKKATKEYQKALMGFDQITKLNSQSDSADSDSSGGSSSGGVSPPEMFETVAIELE